MFSDGKEVKDIKLIRKVIMNFHSKWNASEVLVGEIGYLLERDDRFKVYDVSDIGRKDIAPDNTQTYEVVFSGNFIGDITFIDDMVGVRIHGYNVLDYQQHLISVLISRLGIPSRLCMKDTVCRRALK